MERAARFEFRVHQLAGMAQAERSGVPVRLLGQDRSRCVLGSSILCSPARGLQLATVGAMFQRRLESTCSNWSLLARVARGGTISLHTSLGELRVTKSRKWCWRVQADSATARCRQVSKQHQVGVAGCTDVRCLISGLVEVELNVVLKGARSRRRRCSDCLCSGFQRNVKSAPEPEDDNETLCDGCPPSKNKDSV